MNRCTPNHSDVYVNMEYTPPYAIVRKDTGFSVLILYIETRLCILGGSNWSLLKFYARESDANHAYQRFMQLIGKMCKKSELITTEAYTSHYFSESLGYANTDGTFTPWEDPSLFTQELQAIAQSIAHHHKA